jgi:hypothetical protein
MILIEFINEGYLGVSIDFASELFVTRYFAYVLGYWIREVNCGWICGIGGVWGE